ncbi:MAG: ABC transporter permease [Anaerolineaceae bacterium]|nr:ABC transporter permease [Anaerolineaceae bacterium]
MNIGQAILEALESLSANKLRSGLTILGIVIGVAAVIAMLGIGAGAQASITNTINGIGSNLLFISSGNQNVTLTNIQPLTVQDATALGDQSQAPDIALVAPVVNVFAANVTYGKQTSSPSISGVTPVFATARNLTLSEGSFITTQQEQGQAAVAVIGSAVGDRLFGYHVGVTGMTIRIESQPFKIIGVLTTQGGSSFGNADNVMYIPLSTAQTRLANRGRQRLGSIIISATSSDTVTAAQQEATAILESRHKTQPGYDDFTIITQAQILSTVSSVTGVITLFLGGVAGISLLVGGIGIMNIMLVSVTERTREIGLRKAIGARKRDILIQFLTESALLSLFGGIIGIGLGYLIGFGVGKIAAASGSAITPVVSLDSILLATLFSTAVGLFFGIYPANRAASLQPVEALRYE